MIRVGFFLFSSCDFRVEYGVLKPSFIGMKAG